MGKPSVTSETVIGPRLADRTGPAAPVAGLTGAGLSGRALFAPDSAAGNTRNLRH